MTKSYLEEKTLSTYKCLILFICKFLNIKNRIIEFCRTFIKLIVYDFETLQKE